MMSDYKLLPKRDEVKFSKKFVDYLIKIIYDE